MLAIALQGIVGMNSFSAGVLQTLRKEGVKPDLISATNGAILLAYYFLLHHAGLHLAEASSGKWGQVVISKRGRSRIRRFLYLTTMSLVMNNPLFKALHSHNVKVKKIKKMKSIMKLIGKLARIDYP